MVSAPALSGTPIQAYIILLPDQHAAPLALAPVVFRHNRAALADHFLLKCLSGRMGRFPSGHPVIIFQVKHKLVNIRLVVIQHDVKISAGIIESVCV